MLQITKYKVYDLIESVIASGNAMRTEPIERYTSIEFEKGLARMKKLVKASKNGNVHCHDNALTGIRVSFDIIYPQYWTPEFQRYHFADIVTSSSKMHRLLQMDLRKSCNKYVSGKTINLLEGYIREYNSALNNSDNAMYVNMSFKYRDGSIEYCKDKQDYLYKLWMVIISNCPMGLELFMRVSTNYKQLQTIYHQRKNHKLKEDWSAFCKWIESLPYFEELILGEDET